MTEPLALHDDRFFDADPTIRRIARELYSETHDLPIVSPHGHVDPRILVENAPFPEPTSLFVTPDHYILRMLYSQGVSLESMGIQPRDGGTFERNPRRVWDRFAEHSHLFRGTPTGVWLDHQMHELFGVDVRLSKETAGRIYDQIVERLQTPEYLPRALFGRFKIEVLATTDAAADSLVHHQTIAGSGWPGRVIPTFRPDAAFRIAAPGWRAEVETLSKVAGQTIDGYESLVAALDARRAFFKQAGATATDHAVVEPFTGALDTAAGGALFRKAMAGTASLADQRVFEGGLLMEMARMSVADGLVMQLHAGSLRDHNRVVADRFGSDRGGDIPVATEFTRNLRPLLDAFGNDPRLTLILFTLDESTYSRELAPLAGHYPAVRLGSPWWFHDSLEGMTRFRERTTETAGIYNTVGFNDDTRAFCSIPARHDLARRVDANWLARLVSRHIIGQADARTMARDLACDLARSAYKLGDAR